MMCATLNKTPEKERFQLTLLEIEKSIEYGERILKEFIKQNKNEPKRKIQNDTR